jgi:hypothetical protein
MGVAGWNSQEDMVGGIMGESTVLYRWDQLGDSGGEGGGG